ncbi:hypothetical protein DFH08DRAFT_813274 [Mycena albidolilacea]|uniref:Uncharacterized protein n=1 Tax=Mycena albidolilacea TaxID=1033008 RepID=A0AAD6ZSG0_9AGAR|nr:hypothetical protein DFH08DRAFT_813274 [Mycena albidolilacea]
MPALQVIGPAAGNIVSAIRRVRGPNGSGEGGDEVATGTGELDVGSQASQSRARGRSIGRPTTSSIGIGASARFMARPHDSWRVRTIHGARAAWCLVLAREERGGRGKGSEAERQRTARRWQSRAVQAACKIDVRAPAGKGKRGNEELKRDGDGDGDGARGAELDAYLEAGRASESRAPGHRGAFECESVRKRWQEPFGTHLQLFIAQRWLGLDSKTTSAAGFERRDVCWRRFASDVVFRELQWMRKMHNLIMRLEL